MDFRHWLEAASMRDDPKIPFWRRVDVLKQYAQDPWVFGSFTSIDKLGINPSTTFNTPVGIYAYPVSYLINAWNPSTARFETPFADEMPYLRLFRAKQPDSVLVFDPKKRSLSQHIKDAGEARSASEFDTSSIHDFASQVTFPREKELQAIFDDKADFVDAKIDAIQRTEYRARSDNSPIWDITRAASKGSPARWTKILLSLGYSGCIDWAKDGDDATIHENEPTQAVFFGRQFIQPLEVIPNKFAMQRTARRNAKFGIGGDWRDVVEPGMPDIRYQSWHTGSASNETYKFIMHLDKDPAAAIKSYQENLAALPRVLNYISLDFDDQSEMFQFIDTIYQQSSVLVSKGSHYVSTYIAPLAGTVLAKYKILERRFQQEEADGAHDPNDFKTVKKLMALLAKSTKSIP